MNKLLDKLLIFTFCLLIYLKNNLSVYAIVPVLLAIIFSCILDLLESYTLKPGKIKLTIFGIYILICFFQINFIYFIPLIFYDIFNKKEKLLLILLLIPFYYSNISISNDISIIVIPFILISCLIKYRTLNLEKSKKDYSKLRDNSVEYSILLSNKNKDLIQKQDYEINIAILKERNRISMEIHDNVGHLLSSAILQIGALMATTKDLILRENLDTLKTTLSKGMNSIRCSIHNMHDEYIDLELGIKKIIDTFSFCPINLEYDIKSNIDKKYKFCFISIIKESLANIIKHSNATYVKVILREHPGLYQLIISDNGTKKTNINSDGIGITNMKERVNDLSGVINISDENGFCIFISIPKNK